MALGKTLSDHGGKEEIHRLHKEPAISPQKKSTLEKTSKIRWSESRVGIISKIQGRGGKKGNFMKKKRKPKRSPTLEKRGFLHLAEGVEGWGRGRKGRGKQSPRGGPPSFKNHTRGKSHQIRHL